MAKQKKQGITPEEAQSSRAEGPNPDAISFGNWLRQQREMREIGVREIADASKISVRYLEALEEDRFDLLPAAVFARGFLRQYARYVGLDADEVVNYYLAAREAHGPEEKTREPEFSVSGPDHSLPIGAILAAVLVLAAIVATIWFYFFRGEPAEKPVPIATQQESPVQQAPRVTVSEPPLAPLSGESTTNPAVDEAGAPIRLTLDFRQDCWVEATVDGQRQVAEMRVQGESLTLDAEVSVELRLGNASGVDAQLNGRPYNLGESTGRVRRILVDLDAVRELAELPVPRGTGVSGLDGGRGAVGASGTVGSVSWRLPGSAGSSNAARSSRSIGSTSAVVVLPPPTARSGGADTSASSG